MIQAIWTCKTSLSNAPWGFAISTTSPQKAVAQLWRQICDLMSYYWNLNIIIKSPWYIGGADACSRDNFWTTFWISFIFGTIVGPNLCITWLDFGWFSPWPWPRFFKVKYGICYISAKNGPIDTNRKANIDWTLGLKCDHQVWPQPWPWPRFFKVKYGIWYILAKNGLIATERKASISVELQASNVTNGIWPWP